MDEAFGGPGRSVEQELINMIQRDMLKARIDKHNRVSAILLFSNGLIADM
jgi:hypothetical protein